MTVNNKRALIVEVTLTDSEVSHNTYTITVDSVTESCDSLYNDMISYALV